MSTSNRIAADERDVLTVGRDTLIFSVGNLAIKAVTFFLIPVYTHYLDMQEVGAYVLLELAEMLYGYIALLGVPSALFRYFYRYRSEGKEKPFVASNYYFLIIANAIGFVLLLGLAKPLHPVLLPAGAGSLSLLKLYFVTLFFGFNRNFLLTILRAYSKSGLFVLVSIGQALLFIFFNIYFIVFLKMGLLGFVWAKFISSGSVFLITLLVVVFRFGVAFQISFVRQTLAFGVPLIAHGISLLVLAMSDRYIIKELISIEAAGIYGIAYKFGMILNMVLVAPFLLAWNPMLYKLENQPGQVLTYQRTGLYFTQISMILWLMVSIGAKYLIWWTTTPAYFPGIVIVPFIAFSYILYGLQGIFSAGALLNNKTIYITMFGVMAAVGNICLNIVLIPRFVYLGAAIATVLSYAFLTTTLYLLSQKYLPIRWLWRKMIAVILLGFIFYLISLITVSSKNLLFLRDVCVVGLFLIVLLRLKLISYSEVKRFAAEMINRK